MTKKQFEQNLDSNFIQFRIKPGEKREIYEYAVNHGFDNISSFIKQLVFEKVRGEQEEKQEARENTLGDIITEMTEKLTKQTYLLEELIPSILDIKKKLEEEDNE